MSIVEMSVKESNPAHVRTVFRNGEVAIFNLNEMYRNCDCSDPRGAARKIATQILSSRGLHVYKGENPFQKFNETFGCTVKACLTYVRGFVYHTRIKPVEKWVNRLCRGSNKGSYNWLLVDKVYHRAHLIDKLEKDSLENIVPLVTHCPVDIKEPTQYLKNKFGKSLWKTLLNNSMTRNKYLADTDRVTTIENCYYYPSTFLKRSTKHILRECSNGHIPKRLMEQVFTSVRLTSKESVFYIGRYYHLINDTMDMYRRFHPEADYYKYFSGLSLKRIEELHKEFTDRIQTEKDKSMMFPISWIDSFNDLYFKIDDYDCVIYNTKYDIKQEGKMMRHCVGMYAGRVSNGDYLVVSIRKDGTRLSTVGFNVDSQGKTLKLNQHYGICNSEVNEDLVKVQQKMMKKLQDTLDNTL